MSENNVNNENLKGAGDAFTSPDGELEVQGVVFVGGIQTRAGKGKSAKKSNVVKTIGYKMYNKKTDSWIYMEKLEAIALVQQLKVTNATIRATKNPTKDGQGNVVAVNYNLNLHPIKKERPFTDADRLNPVFKLTKNGKVENPPELMIKQEDCTEVMWKMIEQAYKNKKPKGNGRSYRKISDEEKMTRIDQAMSAANFQGVKNPFK